MHFVDRTVPFKANTLIYYPAGCTYLPLPDEQDPPQFVTINFDFDRTHAHITETISPAPANCFEIGAALNSHLGCGRMLYQKPFVLQHMGDLKGAFLEIAETFSRMSESSKETAEALLQYVLCRLSDRKEQEKDTLYNRVLEYIALNYATIENNDQVAQALNYHPYYINQYFKAQSGKTLHKYIMEWRLQKGAQLLRSSTQSIADIAHTVGFKNADHFSKCFTQQYHIIPTRFRRTAMLV